MIEKQPQIFSLAHAVLNAATSGPSSRHMISGLVSIESPCSEYSGKTTRSMVGMFFRALVTIALILLVCAARSALVTTTGSCDCTRPITTPSGDLFNPPSPLMGLPSSHDCPRIVRAPTLPAPSRGEVRKGGRAPLRAYFVTLSSPGAPFRVRCVEEVAIMIAKVST